MDYKLADPVVRSDLRRCKVEARVVVDIDTGAVVGHFGRHPTDEDPTESRRFEVVLSDADRLVIYRRIRAAAIAAGVIPAMDSAET